MNRRTKETLRVRIISVGFACLAIAVFKPIGFSALGLMLYVHLLAIWALGVGVCYITEVIVTHVLNRPASLEKGAEYIIRRNAWFQVINSPLEALLICTYLHFPMKAIGAESPLSWIGFIQVLLVIAFCSFAIGLYWRYKFRSRYLAAELEETRLLNEQLKALQSGNTAVKNEAAPTDKAPAEPMTGTDTEIVLSGSTNERITLHISDLLYIEAVGNYVKVNYLSEGQVRTTMLRATSKQMEDDLSGYPMVVRCHRAFLVNLAQVERIVSKSGSMQLVINYSKDYIPVSRSNIAHIKETVIGKV